jgi:hypothetical protein
LIAGPLLGGILGNKGNNLLAGVSIGTLVAQAAWLPVGGCLVYVATHRRNANPPAPSAT